MSRSFATDAAKQRFGAFHLKTLFPKQATVIFLCLISDCALGQTTRTGPSSAATSPSIPSSSSTSPAAPCVSSNPTSPCYSAGAPRNPCYSAVSPDQPCSATTTLTPRPSPTPLPPASQTASKGAVHALTQDQARGQIEAKGYSNVSALRRDATGVWRGKAEKDGLLGNVTLDREGNVTAY